MWEFEEFDLRTLMEGFDKRFDLRGVRFVFEESEFDKELIWEVCV